MSRTRASAKAAGTRFERLIADYLRDSLNDDRIDRRARSGTKDRGDITGLYHHGQRIVIECKNTARTNLAGWAAETEVERLNDDAGVGVIAHKRQGRAAARDQWVTMTLVDFAALIGGDRL